MTQIKVLVKDPNQKKTETNELLLMARQLLPDYTLCKRCGKPLTALLSVHRGYGERCELHVAYEEAQKDPSPSFDHRFYRGQLRRVK